MYKPLISQPVGWVIVITGMIVFTMLVGARACAQETCKSCPDLREQFPEAPSTQPHPKIFSKSFFLMEGLAASAISWDAYETISNEGRCGLEGHNGFPEFESGKELATEGAIEFGAGLGLTALLKLTAPKHFKWSPYLIPGYEIGLHLHGGIQWYNRCH